MNHYVYRTTHLETGEFYIGRRTTTKVPSKDPYLGSGTWILFSGIDRSKLKKEVVATFADSEKLRIAEIAEIEKHLGNPLLKNRKAGRFAFACKSLLAVNS